MTPREVVAPTAEPLTIDEARVHLRQLSDADVTANLSADVDDDSWVLARIKAVRQWAEGFLGFKLTDATYEVAFDEFTDSTSLLVEGAVTITSVQYLDAAHALQTLSPAAYTFDAWHQTIYITAAWPALSSRASPIRVRYKADATAVTEDIKTGLLLLLGHLYENREASVIGVSVAQLPMGVEAFLRPHRISLGMA